MKTILLATSLSDNSAWAADYALELAKKLGADLTIVHAYDPDPAGGLAYESVDVTAMRHLSRLRTRMMKSTKGSVTISVVARPGEPETVIETEIAAQNADLLIMGLAGEDPQKARTQGSLARKLIPRTRVPMLLVPLGAHYQTVQTIVLAVDLSSPVDTLALASAKRFAQLFGATLNIICMENEPNEPLHKAAEGICNLLSDLPHTFSFLPGNDLALVLDDYADSHQADLIMLLPKPHNRLESLLMESVTQQVVRQARVPVLATV
ncbi:MAG: universal stress protein [Rudanella sp.]|nr:universal stress protein [Rudanella sp.]